MEHPIYNIQGKETGKVTLPEAIFGLPWNADLVHQVVTSMQSNTREPIAHTKNRGEVRGGGKKPWAQKGTGRARVGSSRSPIWKGGGVTHGPRNEKIYDRKINRQASQKALLVVLSRKAKDGELIFVDSLDMTLPKTSVAKAMMMAFAPNFSGITKKKNAALIALPSANPSAHKSFRNLGNVSMTEVRNLNPLSVMSAKYLVIANPAAAFEVLGSKKVAQSTKSSKKSTKTAKAAKYETRSHIDVARSEKKVKKPSSLSLANQ